MINLSEKKVAYSNAEAALLDLGDGIACLEFRSKGNSISPLVREFILETLAHNLYDFDGMIIGSQSKHFSVGANLNVIKENIDKKNFGYFENSVKSFQDMTAAIKYCKKPIVAAPYRMVLGGGLEVTIHSSARVALRKCYMGLVEIGVGLLPGGGGTKESAFLLKGAKEEDIEKILITLYEKLVCGKVSKDAEDAKKLLFLSDSDIIVDNEDELLDVAKQKCLELVKEGYKAKQPDTVVLPGKKGYDLMIKHGEKLLEDKIISPYDFEVGKKIALILSGSSTEGPKEYTETEVLAQERRCFIELTQSSKTYDRISYFLQKNEKLRN